MPLQPAYFRSKSSLNKSIKAIEAESSKHFNSTRRRLYFITVGLVTGAVPCALAQTPAPQATPAFYFPTSATPASAATPAAASTAVQTTPQNVSSAAAPTAAAPATATPAGATAGDAALEKLLAPIALYPDSLLAQVLAASTYPLDVAKAAQVVELGGTAKDGPMYEWDASITELMNFPDVLKKMAADIAGTTALGEAFLTNADLVFSTIQDLRARAQASGALQTTEQQTVVEENNVISIAPSDPTVIYVPQYEPTAVYAEPVYAYPSTEVVYPTDYSTYYPTYAAGTGLAFAAGIAVSDEWDDYDVDWDDGDIDIDADDLDDIDWDDVDWGDDVNIDRDIGEINIDNSREDFFNNVKGDLSPEQHQKVKDSFNKLDPAKQQDFLKNWNQLPADRKNQIGGEVRREQKLQPAQLPAQQPGRERESIGGEVTAGLAGAAAGAAGAAALGQRSGKKTEWKHDNSRPGAVGSNSSLYKDHSGKAQEAASQRTGAQQLPQTGRAQAGQGTQGSRPQAGQGATGSTPRAPSSADIQNRLQADSAQRGTAGQAKNITGSGASSSRPQQGTGSSQQRASSSQQRPSSSQQRSSTPQRSSSSQRPSSSQQRQSSSASRPSSSQSRSAVSGSGSRPQTAQHQQRGSQSRQSASRPQSRPPSRPSGGGGGGGRRR